MKNPRERKLAILVGVVVIGALGYQFTNWAVIQPVKSAQKNLRNATDRRTMLAAKVAARTRTESTWTSKASFTLALNAKDAAHRFARDIEQLLDRSGLSEGRSISVLAEQRSPNGLVEQPVSIGVKGTMDELARFLEELYRRPYPIRVRSLTVTPDESAASPRAASGAATSGRSNGGATARDRRSGGTAAPRDNDAAAAPRSERSGNSGANTRVTINLTATTLVIPPFKSYKHDALGEDPAAWPEGPLRLARDRDAYVMMASALQFTKWRPPPPEPPPAPRETPVATTRPAVENRPVVRVDPRKDADKKIVVGVTSLHGERYAYVRDDTSRSGLTERVRASEPLDDGTLLLIHPRGLVVRVLQADAAAGAEDGAAGEHTPVIDYWYPLGKSFREREEFRPDVHPEVAVELARVSDI